MAENSSSGMKSFSDSEITLLDPEVHTEGSGRTRNHSEKNFAFLKSQQLMFSRNRNENNSNIISDINNQSLEEVKSALRSLSVPSKQGLKNMDESKIQIKDGFSCIQDQEKTDDTEKSPSRYENIVQDKQNVNDEHGCDYNTKETSDGELERQEISPDEPISHRNSFEVKQNDTQNSETRNVNTEISSPYQVLERANLSVQPSENDLLGEPRCLAIKKYAADEDEEFDLDLVMNADIEDDDELLMDKPSEIVEKKKNLPPDPNDMFLDDDPDDVTEVKNIQYVNLESPSKIGVAWDCSKLEKEEGELSPDVYRTHYDLGNSKNTISKKTRAAESNLEFLNKVNRCFRQLEREFSNMHVASESKRTVEHLRDLLSVVERMKRKLTVLISSTSSRRNTSKNKDSRNSKEKDHISDESSGKSVSEDNSKKMNNPDYKDFDDIQTKQLNKYLEERRKKYYEKKAENYLSQNVLAPQPKLGEIISKKEYLRRTHSGSKIEKQRIKSLFKRQMNLITKQIIQQNDQDKHHTPKKILGAKSASKQPSLENLKSLDDMECFLDLLKEKKGQKITPEDIIRDIHKKKLLKFTTKKRSPVAKTRALPVLLGAANEQAVEKIIPKEITDSSIDLAQPDVSEVIDQLENQTDTSEKIQQYNEKPTKDVGRNHGSDKIRDDHTKKGNFSHSLNVKQSSKSNLSKPEKSKEQKVGKNVTKTGEIDSESKDLSLNRIEFCAGERVTSSKEVIDSPLLKRNSKETKSSESIFHSKASDFEKDSWEIFPESSKKRIRKKSLGPKSSESDRDSKRDQILKKQKRNESKDDSRRKLSSSDLKRDSVSERKSGTRYRSDFGDVIDNRREKLPEELLTKQLFIVGDKNLEILDNYFRVKVKDNQIYLQKVGKSRKSRLSRSKEGRSTQIKEQEEEEEAYLRNLRRKEQNDPPTDSEDAGATLKEMEEFLQQLRSKKDSSVKQNDTPLQNQQIREMKFMARIQAKRKAKLMACVSTTPNISEKEAKFLKDLENRSKNPGDSPETESKKQKLMEKIRAETDFIVLSQKQAAALEDDPLSDVKSFLSLIKEAESANDENSKQFYVSFSMKRSDVKQLENITTGKASALSDESQRLLNSVRAKMRAKKAPPTMENEEPQTVV